MIVKNEGIGEEYTLIKHRSGADIIICPKKGFSKYYAIVGTKYGSMNNIFEQDGQRIEVPEGIAHFLEHKLFENENENVMEKFGLLGAYDNAYTSFDKTAYLFTCTGHFYECFDLLLSFVTAPYFTDESVDKEQGIIAQEIKMYKDSADWCVFFNVLRALFHSNPVNIDIAGTVESIAEITPELLYLCYRSFYKPSNMAVCVVGDVEESKVLELCDRYLKADDDFTVKTVMPEEPSDIVRKKIEQNLSVNMPQFCIGIKDNHVDMSDARALVKQSVATDILINLICGETSELHKLMYSQGLINRNFSCGYESGANFGLSMFTGESHDPDKVFDLICAEMTAFCANGIDEKAFTRSKNALYGQFARTFNSVERTGNMFMNTFVIGASPYDYIDAYKEIDAAYAMERLKQHFNPEYAALSVINPV